VQKLSAQGFVYFKQMEDYYLINNHFGSILVYKIGILSKS